MLDSTHLRISLNSHSFLQGNQKNDWARTANRLSNQKNRKSCKRWSVKKVRILSVFCCSESLYSHPVVPWTPILNRNQKRIGTRRYVIIIVGGRVSTCQVGDKIQIIPYNTYTVFCIYTVYNIYYILYTVYILYIVYCIFY